LHRKPVNPGFDVAGRPYRLFVPVPKPKWTVKRSSPAPGNRNGDPKRLSRGGGLSSGMLGVARSGP
jgi:hypothetical protein